MSEAFDGRTAVMARLTISALDRLSSDSSCWKEPSVHRAILVSGLSVLTSLSQILDRDLKLIEKKII